ncbi:probable protein phosphatase 2C 6 [Rutidosis leptorrhynchoides]|uniref:probable protein phosphatase 2C 6 n=1 Tax=Rutidosis leptorrhynchoides TaxID=125765 RepID=UPI003A98F450
MGPFGVDDDDDEKQLERVDSLISEYETLASSTSSSLSSLASIISTSTDDSRSTTTSSFGDILSGSSGEVPAAAAAEDEQTAVMVETALRMKKKCVGRNNRAVSWGFTSVIGRRKEMEDAVAVVPAFMSRTCYHVGGCTAPGSRTSGEVSPVHFFAVYDGHGGAQVAEFCKERMHRVIAEEWGRETINGDDEWKKKWESAFSDGFQRTDDEVFTGEVAPDMIGSTAVVVVVSGCQIITSNCGDSRALLCTETQTIPLTVDQKPDREDELVRIEAEGGRVINWNGARVFGVLAMSRAIGDRYLRPWIIPEPEITFMTRTDEDECLIVASDGLWDVMTNEEVGQLARRVIRRRRRFINAAANNNNNNNNNDISPAQAVADTLTEIALRRNSSDNISVIVVDLKPKKRRQQRT